MTKTCAFCQKVLVWPEGFSCYYCGETYCGDHRIAENHECPKVMAAKHVKKDRLREKGVNITTGRYAVVCDQCGYDSGYSSILEANKMRNNHMKVNGCSSEKVWLRRHPDDLAVDRGLGEKSSLTDNIAGPTPALEGGDWMYDCLTDAKDVIKTFHSPYCSCSAESFFRSTTYELFIQNTRQDAYAYINVRNDSTCFQIGVHPVLSERTPYNKKALVVVFVHELLHAIHPDWNHDRINPQEKLLANKAGYYDALVELQRLAISGKMRLCNN